MSSSPLPVAVLISGGGTTLRNLIEKIQAGRLAADICLVVSSNSRAGGLQFAADAGIPSAVVRRSDAADEQEFSRQIFDACRQADVQLVVMGGFLKRVLVPHDFVNRITNIHPALIPAFCGPGFYGRRVHQAVLDYGAKVSGCTVHFVDDQYDHGPIILQRTVEVREDDTAESLAGRVFEVECEAYPTALQAIAEGRVRVTGRRVRVD